MIRRRTTIVIVHASVVAGLARPAGASVEAVSGAMPATAKIPAGACNRIDDFTRRHQGFEACLFALNGPGDTLSAAYATPRVREAFAALRVPVGSAVSGWVAANRSTIRDAEAVLDIGDWSERFGLTKCTSVPIFVCGDLMGVFTVYGMVANLDEHTAPIGLLAQEIGLLIARARSPLDVTAPTPFAAVS